MAQGVNLDTAVLDLDSLRKHARRSLIQSLDNVPGRKALVLDPKLSGPLALVVQTSLLKEHGVENLFHATAEPIQTDCPSIIYLLRPRSQLVASIVSQIRADQKQNTPHSYFAYFVPKCTLPCRRVLESSPELSQLAVGVYPLQFFPLEDDAVSLELESAFKEFHVDLVRTSMLDAARALATLQTAFGVAPLLKGKGEAAHVVANAMVNIMREQKGTVPPLPHSAIAMMVLIDRKVDLVTPMCTQLTYEGLLDELLGIQNAAVEVDPAIMAAPPSSTMKAPAGPASPIPGAPPTKKMKVPLNSSDKLFKELRDVNFGVAAEALRAKAMRMKADYATIKTSTGASSAVPAGGAESMAHKGDQEQQGSQAREEQQGSQAREEQLGAQAPVHLEGQARLAGRSSHVGCILAFPRLPCRRSVSDLKDFVKKLNALPELTRHTNLAQHIAQSTNRAAFAAHIAMEQSIIEGRNIDGVCEYIEDMIGRQEPLARVLRMLVLVSATCSGLPRPKLDSFRREIVQSYGIRSMLPLSKMETAGLLVKQEARGNWPMIKRILRLVVEDDDDYNPKDIAFMYSGYAPISIRLVQSATEGAWKAQEDALRALPGPSFEWKVSADGCEWIDSPDTLERRGQGKEQQRRVVVVVFLGGVTHAEIAALRYLSRKDTSSIDYLVITTKVVSGSSLLGTILDAS